MRNQRLKLTAIILFVVFFIVVMTYRTTSANGAASPVVDDPAAAYKAKCAACHTPNASKFYDPAKADDVQVEAILKGKKGEKPPYMPGFEAKGMTEAEAKALNEHMKGLRKAN